MSSETKSLLLHDFVQGLNLLTVAGMFVSGLLFVTDIRQDTQIQKAKQDAQERRIKAMEERQADTDSKIETAVKDLREEQGRKLEKIDAKLDRLIERQLQGRQ